MYLNIILIIYNLKIKCKKLYKTSLASKQDNLHKGIDMIKLLYIWTKDSRKS